MPLAGTLPAPSVTPICPYFYECGGCDLQDVSYTEQLAWKQAGLEKLFSQLEPTFLPILGSASDYPIFFRSKIRFAFVVRNGVVRPSRHRKGEEAGDIAIDECFLQSPETNPLINWLADWATSHAWDIYDPATGQGWFKHVLIRQGKRTGETMVSLVTSDRELPEQAAFIAAFTAAMPFVTSLYQTRTRDKDVLTFTDHHLWGDLYLHEKIGDYVYQISPHAFFQTNAEMVGPLYDLVAQKVGENVGTLWDLYAGSATIGIHLHKLASQVICIENNPDNIRDALANIEANGAENVRMLGAEVEEAVNGSLLREHGRPDVVVVDPPRAGLSEQTRTILTGVSPKRLIYISCNPITLLRDCKDLIRRGFKLESVQGVDMFPQTVHCEAVAEFSRI